MSLLLLQFMLWNHEAGPCLLLNCFTLDGIFKSYCEEVFLCTARFLVSDWSSFFISASLRLLCLYTTPVTDAANNPSSDVFLLICWEWIWVLAFLEASLLCSVICVTQVLLPFSNLRLQCLPSSQIQVLLALLSLFFFLNQVNSSQLVLSEFPGFLLRFHSHIRFPVSMRDQFVLWDCRSPAGHCPQSGFPKKSAPKLPQS